MRKSRRAPLEKTKRLVTLRRCAAIAALGLILSPAFAFARSLAEYRESVELAAALTIELLAYTEENLQQENRDVAFERETLGEIRRLVPPTEKIDWEAGTIETGNEWLADRLKAYENSADWKERFSIASETRERLASLKSRVGELDDAAAAERSKDEDKRKLAEILRREEYQKPIAEESWFEKTKKRFEDWLEQMFPRPKVPETSFGGFRSLSTFLQIVLYVVILGLIGFLIYRFAPLFARRFRREEAENEERVILGERLKAHENAQSLFGEAEALARAGDLRGAIRKGYIAVLCELGDRKIVGLAQHKTNRDYLRDVRKKSALHQSLRGLTDNFERHWYGFEQAGEEDWAAFKRDYRQAVGENLRNLQ